MSKAKIRVVDLSILWTKSGYRCAICKKVLIDTDIEGNLFPLGEKAHIEGEKPAAARYNKDMTDKERGNYRNLILLCPECHTKIDKNHKAFPVDLLKHLKKEHEDLVYKALKSCMPDVTFAELEVILKYLKNAPIDITFSDYKITDLDEKIIKNKLSSDAKRDLTLGLQQVKQVKDYLNKNPDPQFSKILTSRFINKYKELKHTGLPPDDIFYNLCNFSSNYSIEYRFQAAGLSVLTYFEQCEVFEK